MNPPLQGPRLVEKLAAEAADDLWVRRSLVVGGGRFGDRRTSYARWAVINALHRSGRRVTAVARLMQMDQSSVTHALARVGEVREAHPSFGRTCDRLLDIALQNGRS